MYSYGFSWSWGGFGHSIIIIMFNMYVWNTFLIESKDSASIQVQTYQQYWKGTGLTSIHKSVASLLNYLLFLRRYCEFAKQVPSWWVLPISTKDMLEHVKQMIQDSQVFEALVRLNILVLESFIKSHSTRNRFSTNEFERRKWLESISMKWCFHCMPKPNIFERKLYRACIQGFFLEGMWSR